MAVGIWTPAIGSAQIITFGDPLLRLLSDKVRAVTLMAGTHMRIRPQGCGIVYVCTSNPATDAAGFLGIPVYPDDDVVLPAIANFWLYSPYAAQTVQLDTGALT